jgi:hypothetical protein
LIYNDILIVYQTGKTGLTDYKVYNFNGNPQLVLVCKNRFEKTGITEDYFSTNWEHLGINRPNIKLSETDIDKPEELEEMLNLSRQLSIGIPFIRTDFYIINHHLYFGELTFYPASGFVAFSPKEWDKKLGNMIRLRY